MILVSWQVKKKYMNKGEKKECLVERYVDTIGRLTPLKDIA